MVNQIVPVSAYMHAWKQNFQTDDRSKSGLIHVCLCHDWHAWRMKIAWEHVWRPRNNKMKTFILYMIDKNLGIPHIYICYIPYVIHDMFQLYIKVYDLFKSQPSPGWLSWHHRFCGCWQEGCAGARHAPGLPDSKCPGHNQPKEVRPWDDI